MENRPLGTLTGLAIAAVVVLAVAVGIAVVLRTDTTGSRGSGLSDAFRYLAGRIPATDPALIGYDMTSQIIVGMKRPRALAVGPGDRIHVAGDRAVAVFEPGGIKRAEIPLDNAPQCLAVGDSDHAFPGRIYVGMSSRLEVYDPDGKHLATWEDLGAKALVSSIAAGPQDIFVADAGNRIVYRYDTTGRLLSRIGQRDPGRNIPGFVVPSPCFDVATHPDGLLRVVNPGRHRIEAYTFDGHLEQAWGTGGEKIEQFCGCCNPVNIAVLADGRVVTAEKGIPRVKVYDADGAFLCVVVGPDSLAPTPTAMDETRQEHRLPIFDVAADSRGRVLVLDPRTSRVRIFEPRARSAPRRPPAPEESKMP